LQTRRRAAAQGWLEPTPWGRTLGRTGPLIENRRQGERNGEKEEEEEEGEESLEEEEEEEGFFKGGGGEESLFRG